ncbi:phage tail tip lysozyme, partial [Lacticaseibacillus rhamnosus]|nr:phage tail tip lysozyme [Lacticaseibacillus rhamnosus]
MQVLSFEYKKKKWKLIAYIVGGAILLIILLIAAVTGQLQENSCDNSTTTETQLDSKSMTENAKNIYAHWKQKYGATPQAAAGILGVLQLESRLDPKSVNSSSGATGLAQWL